MKIFPAIDLKGGRCVRLRQGRAEDETVYSDDPVRMALSWQEQGAEFLHVVDLDGAFAGRPAHLDVFRALAAALRIPFEVGEKTAVDALNGISSTSKTTAQASGQAFSNVASVIGGKFRDATVTRCEYDSRELVVTQTNIFGERLFERRITA